MGLSLVNIELRKKLGFHRIRVMVLNIFRSTHIAEQHLFLCFLQFLLLMLSNLRVVLAFFGPKCAILRVRIRFRNCFGSQRLLCLNPTTVNVVLLFGLWLLLGCDKTRAVKKICQTELVQIFQ